METGVFTPIVITSDGNYLDQYDDHSGEMRMASSIGDEIQLPQDDDETHEESKDAELSRRQAAENAKKILAQ